MGQCYSVEAKLCFKDNDPTLFCETIKAEISKRNGVSAEFDLTRGDLNDPFDCFKILTSKNADWYDDLWYADFSASYGWGEVMRKIFSEAAKRGLAAGSQIDICPWESEEILIRV